MRSIERRLMEMVHKHPNHSSLVCFEKAVYRQRFSREIVVKWFNRLVDSGDYEAGDRKSILDYVCLLSKPTEEMEIRHQIDQGQTLLFGPEYSPIKVS